MQKPIVKVKQTNPDNPLGKLPEYKTLYASGADLYYTGANFVIPPGGHGIFSTNITLEIPPGFEAQVRSRSGLAATFGVFVLNSPGTIDSDYRGEIQVILANFSWETVCIAQGARIAQLVIAPVVQVEFVLVSELDETERGGGGFGSTGVI